MPSIPALGPLDPAALQTKFDTWVKSQHPSVEVFFVGLQSAVTGAGFGYLLGSMSSMNPETPTDPANAAMSAQLKALNAGGPWGQAKNLAALMGTNAALNLAIKKCRGGKDDVYGSMGASFGSGFVYSIVSGAPNPLQAALTTGLAFALFNGLFYQIGQMFKPDQPDTAYDRATYMLQTLGLTKYGDNLKKQLLTDNTIMLWNESALSDAKIPAGPRLLILHHLDQFRNPGAVLKPALPLPMPPPRPAAPRPAAAAAAGGSR